MLRKHIGFGLTLVAIGLFVPGIIMPMFSLNMEIAAQLGASAIQSDLVNKELSIIATVRELWEDQRFLVAFLIFAFSVCVPVLKSVIVSIAYFSRGHIRENRLMNFVGVIGKWSMADVFVVAIFLAVLSTNHAETQNRQELNVFGMSFKMDLSTQTLSAIGPGFYYFTAYCLLSLLAVTIYPSRQSKVVNANH